MLTSDQEGELKTNGSLKDSIAEKSEHPQQGEQHVNGNNPHSFATNGKHSSNGGSLGINNGAPSFGHMMSSSNSSSSSSSSSHSHHSQTAQRLPLHTRSGFVFDRSQVLRLMIQALFDWGYHNVAEHLQLESGFCLEHDFVSEFQRYVLTGNWQGIENVLPKLRLEAGKKTKRFKLLLYRQRFLELLEECRVTEAISCLHEYLTPLLTSNSDKKTLYSLSTLIMYSTPEQIHQLKQQACWDGAKGKSRQLLLEKLQSLLPSELIVPEKRLLVLLDQAIQHQIDQCPYHNKRKPTYSLLETHSCSRSQIPCDTYHVLSEHKDEVWAVQFSHDGKRLASASSDKTVIIWDCKPDTSHPFSLFSSQSSTSLLPSAESPMSISGSPTPTQYESPPQHQQTSSSMFDGDSLPSYSGPQDAATPAAAAVSPLKIDCPVVIFRLAYDGHISSIAWSPNDRYLLACSEKTVILWDMTTGNCLAALSDHSEPSCAWLPSSDKFVTTSLDRVMITVWDLKGSRVDTILGAGSRINYVGISGNGSRLVCTTTEMTILVYDLTQPAAEFLELKETQMISSFCLSHDPRGKFALVNVAPIDDRSDAGEIHLWDLDRQKVIRKFLGLKQSRFVVRSDFGGMGPPPRAFIIGGSEDSQVYIWHRDNGKLLEVLPGHSGTVNAVSWSPTDPHVFVTASDDHTIRVWGLQRAVAGRRAPPIPHNVQALRNIFSEDDREDEDDDENQVVNSNEFLHDIGCLG